MNLTLLALPTLPLQTETLLDTGRADLCASALLALLRRSSHE
jgi:hypothetical protein